MGGDESEVWTLTGLSFQTFWHASLEPCPSIDSWIEPGIIIVAGTGYRHMRLQHCLPQFQTGDLQALPEIWELTHDEEYRSVITNVSGGARSFVQYHSYRK